VERRAAPRVLHFSIHISRSPKSGVDGRGFRPISGGKNSSVLPDCHLSSRCLYYCTQH
jgi:hypothetical protein